MRRVANTRNRKGKMRVRTSPTKANTTAAIRLSSHMTIGKRGIAITIPTTSGQAPTLTQTAMKASATKPKIISTVFGLRWPGSVMVVWPLTMVIRQTLPAPVHGWIFYLRLGSWADESGRADFIQDYSPNRPPATFLPTGETAQPFMEGHQTSLSSCPAGGGGQETGPKHPFFVFFA